jgi:hypothetical protein
VLSAPKRTPRKPLDSDEYPERVETTPRVFGPVTYVPKAKLVHAQPYRTGPRARENELSGMHRMLLVDFIEPASSEWASPVVLVHKPDGSMRFYFVYRRLNAIKVRDSYHLPRMDECIDLLGDAQLFSTLECNSGCCKILVEPSN